MVLTQATEDVVRPNASAILGRAILTIVPSRDDMNAARDAEMRMSISVFPVGSGSFIDVIKKGFSLL